MSFKLPQIKELNSTQKMILKQIPNAKKMAVIGGPGTGKTIIALMGAAKMAAKGKRCCFVTHSRPLYNFLAAAAKDCDMKLENIDFMTYHDWLWDLLADLGVSAKEFQIEEYIYDIDMLLDFIRQTQIPAKNHYDYFFLDEAQDVQEGTVKVIPYISDHLFVSFDDCQKITNHYFNALETYDHSHILENLGIEDTFYDLIDNYRNSSQIENIAKSLLLSYDLNLNEIDSLKKITSKRAGEKITLIHTNSEDYINLFVDYLIDKYDPNESVGIFISNDSTNRDSSKSIFKEFHEVLKAKMLEHNLPEPFYKFGSFNINRNNATSNGIFLMTYVGCKGFEFDRVYMVTNNADIQSYFSRNAAYVAMTRAKEQLIFLVFDDNKAHDAFTRFLIDKSYLCDHEILK